MNDLKRIAPWVAAALVAAAVIAWAFPRLFPLFPRHWQVTAGEAKAIALERARDLGEPVADPYVVVDFTTARGLLERRLLLSSETVPMERIAGSDLARRIFEWRVTLYERGSYPGEWSYRAEVAPDGTLTSLQARVEPDEEIAAIEPAEAIARADAFLRAEGFDLDLYERPAVRSAQLRARTDLDLRYESREAALGDRLRYGLEVHFAGDRLTGFDSWQEDADSRALQPSLQSFQIWNQAHFLGTYLIAIAVAMVFLRLYHAGEVGVRRAVHLFGLAFGAALVVVALVARSATEGPSWGVFTRQQVTWVWGLQFSILFFFPVALVIFLSWSVGESLSRERMGEKLAAFDSLFKGEWDNATVARASLRGLAAGVVLLGVLLGLSLPLRRLGVWPEVSFLLDDLWFKSPLPGLSLVGVSLLLVFYRELFGRLFLVPVAVRRLGTAGGVVTVTLVSALFLFPTYSVLPLGWAIALSSVQALAMIGLFLAYDLLTVLLASATLQVGMGALPLVFSGNRALEVQGWLALAVVAVPAALSVRFLGSRREFVYHWDDVPPHVRRIAERERQRVELETARRIQSSILPELPPRLAGVDLAHAYLPATEVGGDFYDVLALEDGRLAVAVGDVAGHGVSSGLVMSAAKSALAVQVAFDPDVTSVFTTLNRLVYQSARRRLITTLCYAVLDPRTRELVYASAGHLYPYLLGADGPNRSVRALPSTAYPLGVRPELDVSVRRRQLDPGDTVVLISDGIVEARREGSTDLYGFERLEERLATLVGCPPEQVRDGILGDLERFVGNAPREDDQTVLVLRLP